jgi:sialic acid synthase SpsE
MNFIKIGKHKIGFDYNPYIIVEACVNHQGNFEIAKKMIYFAKKSGAQCIKFQHHIINEEMLIKKIPKSSNFTKPLSKVIEETNFTIEQHKKLKKICDKIGINYLCTPFSIKAAKELNEIKVNAFKTGSGELTNLPFIDYIARLKKPMIVSTGMSLPEEINETVKIIKRHGAPLVLTHCVSAYPCPYEIMNLNFISELAKKYKIPVGLSDHTPTIYNALGAVSLGASVIEKHFTFNKKLSGPDHKSSIDSQELEMLIKGSNANFLARGSKKIIFKEEKEIINWARESVVSIKKIPSNNALSLNNISTKRPSPKGSQIPANKFFKILGKKTKKSIPKDKVLNFKDLK